MEDMTDMNLKVLVLLTVAPFVLQTASTAESARWWNSKWRFRTSVTPTAPAHDTVPRPAEVAIDFRKLLQEAGAKGEFDPASVRVIQPGANGQAGTEAPSACRVGVNPREQRDEHYVSWIARPDQRGLSRYDIYFATRERALPSVSYAVDALPSENLVANPGFEESQNGAPAQWEISVPQCVAAGQYAHTVGDRSLKVFLDKSNEAAAPDIIELTQTVDAARYRGQEMLFQCDLYLAEGRYGLPVSIQLQQFREDGSQILECAVEPRWLTIQLARGQLVQFDERGRFSPEIAKLKVHVRLRCNVSDADTGERLTGPDTYFTLFMDRFVVRPGERWLWPPASPGPYAAGAPLTVWAGRPDPSGPGALQDAPLNEGIRFTGVRRAIFCGRSAVSLTAGQYNPDPRSVHWGREAGTIEFWLHPSWDADDDLEHVFFFGGFYGNRLQSRLRKCGADGGNALEFTIVDGDNTARTVRGEAPLRADQWHHIVATWDFARAHLQLFCNGKLVANEGPGEKPWTYRPDGLEPRATEGHGISAQNQPSLPIQATIGGPPRSKEIHAERSADGVMDEFRISDVVRYAEPFTPSRRQFAADADTRALFHFEHDVYGVHHGDDRVVKTFLVSETDPRGTSVLLEVLTGDKVEQRMVRTRERAPEALFERNRAETRLSVSRPRGEFPDPRRVEYREREVECVVGDPDQMLTVDVGGHFEPIMRSITFEPADPEASDTAMLPRWRVGDSVIPFSEREIGETLAADATDEAEKAFRIFEYALHTTNYFNNNNYETLPRRGERRVSYTFLRNLNIYPYDQCGPLNHFLRKLFVAGGISSNQFSGTGHSFEQAFYKGSWRLFDLSPRMYFLERDNRSLLSLRGVEEDPYALLRQKPGLYSYLPARKSGASFSSRRRYHNMDFPLQPGERASICWGNEGAWFDIGAERKPRPLAMIPPHFGNGAVVFEPSAAAHLNGAENLALQRGAAGDTVLRPEDPARPATLTYRFRCPYMIGATEVHGRYSVGPKDVVAVEASYDEGETWAEVWQAKPAQNGAMDLDLSADTKGRYAYWLRVRLRGEGASVRNFRLRTVFVHAPLSLPGQLARGANTVSFVRADASVPVKTTCRWVERYRTDLAVSLNSLSFYTMEQESHLNLFVAPPSSDLRVEVTLRGQRFGGEVLLEGLPPGWSAHPSKRVARVPNPAASAQVDFVVRVPAEAEGTVRWFDVVLRGGEHERRIPVQVLVASAALVCEAESGNSSGEVAAQEQRQLSAARAVRFDGPGELAYELGAPRAGTYALWFRGRWDDGASSRLALRIDDGDSRSLSARNVGGFADWTSPSRADAKVFVHYGEFFSFWQWFRVGDIKLSPGRHRLVISQEGPGGELDALVLLPQTPDMDRAANNLFQNWLYKPWESRL